MALLQIDKMSHYFGGLRAVYNYDLQIDPGQIRGLIGPNGAGKSTVFNLITGIYRPTDGRVLLEGENLVGRRPHEIASKGLGRTFQNLALWRHMTVLEHVNMAQSSQLGYGILGALFATPTRVRREREIEERSRHLLEVFGVGHLAGYLVAGLRRASSDIEIILSPRNVERSARLAARFGATVTVSRFPVSS